MLFLATTLYGQSLAVTFGSNGIQTLSYNGVSLVNLSTNSGDGYSIRHMSISDASGNALSGNGFDYGDAGYSSRTFTQTNSTSGNIITQFPWGNINTSISVSGNSLSFSTSMNNTVSGYIIHGAAIYLDNFRFPALPGSYTQGDWGSTNAVELSFSTLDFGVQRADWGTGLADHVATMSASMNPQYTGWLNDGSGSNNFYAVQSVTFPAGVPPYEPQYVSSAATGSSLVYSSTLNFAPTGTSRATVDAAQYTYLKTIRPFALAKFSDRRPIGNAFLSSNGTSGGQIGSNGISGCGASSSNPRNYKNASGSVDCSLNVMSTAFQTVVLNQALENVVMAQTYGMQGIITWDLEGQEYTQPSSYVGSPDQVATVAPEMEQTVSGQTGTLASYNGMKLDDAYFSIQTSAGVPVGLCLRPQQFVISSDKTTSNQVYLSDSAALTLLNVKLQTITSRWGATMTYIDTFVHQDGGYMDTSVLAGMTSSYPSVRLIPEYQFGATLPAYLQYSFPLANFQTHTDLGTPTNFPEAYLVYPKAGMVNLISDVAASQITQYQTALQNAVNQGDMDLIHGDYPQGNNVTIQKMYNLIPKVSNPLILY